MRFSFVISGWLGYQIPRLFKTESSFTEFQKALGLIRECRFEGVELNLNFKDKAKLRRISKSVQDSGLVISAVGTGSAYIENGLSLSSPKPPTRRKTLALLSRLLAFAAEENATLILGVIRGQEKSSEETINRVRECIKQCDCEAGKVHAKVAVEAINRYETTFYNTAAEVYNLIQNSVLASTGVLLDSFHMNIEEQSLEQAIQQCAPKLTYFQIADSNRWPPGYGHLDLANLLRAVKSVRYDGWVSAETLPKPSSAEAVKITADFLKDKGFLKN